MSASMTERKPSHGGFLFILRFGTLRVLHTWAQGAQGPQPALPALPGSAQAPKLPEKTTKKTLKKIVLRIPWYAVPTYRHENKMLPFLLGTH